ncbi:hypothetical protein QQS21_002744 [Conoideocrella luteorostrata]|uniref:Uncharacterized protein n=1 Tax=Conoideocrella luteorostrata TaxID=1105319 RepID=A0AAJ0CXH9_9HYPO|nr:hypothetical protein QQS21_002744 [Conoideocrella luteorostrata]
MKVLGTGTLLSGSLAVALAFRETCLLQNCAQNALAFAYEYGYPLYAYGVFLEPYNNSAQTNKLYHQRQLASPGAIAVVRPNVDTVYSTWFVDVSSSDVNFTCPEFDDRYWAQSFLDLYGNNVANIGSIGKDKPGTYLVRYDAENPGVQYKNVRGGYRAYINLPTPYGISVTRILVKNKAGDIDNVHRYQNKTSVSERLRSDGSNIPSFNLSIFTDPYYRPGPNVSVELSILRLTAAFSRYNQPVVPQDRTWVTNLLGNAGISQGSFTQPNNTNLTAASAAANASVTALLTTPGFVQSLGNNWTLNQPIGNYGSFYQSRYFIAAHGYLALTKDQTIYPSSPNLKLGAEEAYVLRFSRRPRVSAGGFWSLTVYNEEQLLISNPLHRYALGDRSNLTFPNGKPISDGPDGPFDMLIQASDVKPPSNWTNK